MIFNIGSTHEFLIKDKLKQQQQQITDEYEVIWEKKN